MLLSLFAWSLVIIALQFLAARGRSWASFARYFIFTCFEYWPLRLIFTKAGIYVVNIDDFLLANISATAALSEDMTAFDRKLK